MSEVIKCKRQERAGEGRGERAVTGSFQEQGSEIMWHNGPARPCPGSPACAERCPPNSQDSSAFSGKMWAGGLRQGLAPGDSCMEMTSLLGPVLCWLRVGSRHLWIGPWECERRDGVPHGAGRLSCVWREKRCVESSK